MRERRLAGAHVKAAAFGVQEALHLEGRAGRARMQLMHSAKAIQELNRACLCKYFTLPSLVVKTWLLLAGASSPRPPDGSCRSSARSHVFWASRKGRLRILNGLQLPDNCATRLCVRA